MWELVDQMLNLSGDDLSQSPHQAALDDNEEREEPPSKRSRSELSLPLPGTLDAMEGQRVGTSLSHDVNTSSSSSVNASDANQQLPAAALSLPAAAVKVPPCKFDHKLKVKPKMSSVKYSDDSIVEATIDKALLGNNDEKAELAVVNYRWSHEYASPNNSAWTDKGLQGDTIVAAPVVDGKAGFFVYAETNGPNPNPNPKPIADRTTLQLPGTTVKNPCYGLYFFLCIYTVDNQTKKVTQVSVRPVAFKQIRKGKPKRKDLPKEDAFEMNEHDHAPDIYDAKRRLAAHYKVSEDKCDLKLEDEEVEAGDTSQPPPATPSSRGAHSPQTARLPTANRQAYRSLSASARGVEEGDSAPTCRSLPSSVYARAERSLLTRMG